MDRRGFLIGSAVVLATALTAEAQRPGKVWRVGTLSAGPASHTDEAAFREGLRDLGYTAGQNVLIESRYAEGRVERLSGLTADLIRLNVDVIVASPTAAILAVASATRTIPIVMAFSGDPVGSGVAASLARPGGNVTGLATIAVEVTPKRLEFLKTVNPSISKVAFLTGPTTPRRVLTETEGAARGLGVQIAHAVIDDSSSLERALSQVVRAPVGGIVVSPLLQAHRRRIADHALKMRLASISGGSEFAEAGGLMTYGPSYRDLFRRAAGYVDKILRGAAPGTLPIEQPTTFELIINVRTARALGLTIPPSLLAQADQIIE
jgi:putative tryptophan/tyrosine transport system substrate-binding protein